MTDVVDYLLLDLLEWIRTSPRPYGEVIETWRTSCPRLPVWEEANERGLIEHLRAPGSAPLITLSDAGRSFLRQHDR